MKVNNLHQIAYMLSYGESVIHFKSSTKQALGPNLHVLTWGVESHVFWWGRSRVFRYGVGVENILLTPQPWLFLCERYPVWDTHFVHGIPDPYSPLHFCFLVRLRSD